MPKAPCRAIDGYPEAGEPQALLRRRAGGIERRGPALVQPDLHSVDHPKTHSLKFKQPDVRTSPGAHRRKLPLRGERGNRLAAIGAGKSGSEFGLYGLGGDEKLAAVLGAVHGQLIREDRQIVLVVENAVDTVSRGGGKLNLDALPAGGIPDARGDAQLHAVAERDRG